MYRTGTIVALATALGGLASGPARCQDLVVPTVYEAAEPQQWRVTLAVGSVWANGDPFRSLLQNGELDEYALDVDWQPGAFGLRLGLGLLANENSQGSINSRYDSSELQLAATYVPPLQLQGIQVLIFAGALRGLHHVELNDGDVTISDSGTAVGPVAGIDVGTPPAVAFRVVLRLFVSEQKLKLAALGFDHDLVERGLMIGGSYAF